MTIARTGANLLYDFRLALRALRRRPGFTMSAIAILGLGVGANTTVFSVVDGVLLKSLPYQNPNQLAGVFRYDSTYMGSNPSDASISGWPQLRQRIPATSWSRLGTAARSPVLSSVEAIGACFGVAREPHRTPIRRTGLNLSEHNIRASMSVILDCRKR